MRIAVLGPVVVDGDAGALSPRDRVVLSALVVASDGAASNYQLAEALWGGEPPATRAKVVQGCVVRLRKVLGADAIETVSEGYRLTVSEEEIDARRFERAVRRADELLVLGEADRAAHLAGEALALWRGPALADVREWDAGRIERERLEELRRDAEELQLDAWLRSGRHREVLTVAQGLAAAAPLREKRWALLARAQYQAGRQAAALTTLHRARVMLSTELGLDLGPELVALQEQILHQDPDLVVPDAPPDTATACPWPGLVPYDVGDTEAFFGRTDEIQACLRRLESEGVLALVGPSGRGKSSLVRAGVAARLRRDGRDVVVVTPGARPLDALTAVRSRSELVRSPAPASGPVASPRNAVPVLVVDQAEEAVTVCGDADERSAFFAALVEHAERAPVVLAIRADWIGELTDDPRIARLVERGLHLLGPMRPEELRAVIERPAQQAGLLVEPGLVDLLVREVEDEPGALPLLSHALRATWERREGRTLTVAGYTDSGGIRGAVAQTAEAVYERLGPHRRRILRDLLLRLVVQGPPGDPVRFRLPWSVFADDDEHTALVEELVTARLLTSDGADVELAHEALIRAWPRLRGWIDEDAAGQRILHHVSSAADTWERMGRPDSELYRGVRLAEAVDWRERVAPRLTPVESAFLDAGVEHADAERRAAEDRVLRQARINRRLRALLAGIGLLAVVAVIAGVVAARQAQRADAEAVVAEEAAVAADARRVGAQALAADDLDRALLLAVEGWRLDDSLDTRANLLAALGRSPGLAGVLRAEGAGPLGSVTVSPDGQTIAAYDDANRVWFHDAATGTVRGVFDAGDVRGRVLRMTGRAAFHPGGDVIAVALSTTGERPVRLLDADTFDELPDQPGGFPLGRLLPWDMAFSPDGTRVAVAFDRFLTRGTFPMADDSVVLVWDTATPADPVAELSDVPRFTHGLAFSHDGSRLFTGTHAAPPTFDADAAITVYDVAAGTVDRTLDVPSHPFAVTPDGTRIAAPITAPLGREARDDVEVAARAGGVVVVDGGSGTEQLRLRGHTGAVTDVAFSPDGTRLASASIDGTVIVWDAATGEPVDRFHGHAGTVNSVAFAPDGRNLYSAGADQAVLVWDLTGADRFIGRRLLDDRVSTGARMSAADPYASFSPTADRIVYAWSVVDDRGHLQHAMQFADVDAGSSGAVVNPGPPNRRILPTWHPDGRRVATGGGAGRIRIWDAASAEMLAVSRFGAADGAGHAYLPGRDELLATSAGGIFRRFDAETLEPAAQSFWLPIGIFSLPFAGPDGRTAVIIADDTQSSSNYPDNVFPPEERLFVVDAVAGQVLGELDLGFDGERAAFSPDGATVAVTGRGGQVALIDVATATFVRSGVVGHDGNVTSIDYAPDGRSVASGGVDGRVTLWDGRTGARQATVQVAEPDEQGLAVAFRPDGDTVVVATWDGDVHTFDVRPRRWAEAACAIAGRDLTTAEWEDAFGDRPYERTCSQPRHFHAQSDAGPAPTASRGCQHGFGSWP